MSFMTLPEAAEQLPGRPSRTTVWRWCRVGVLGASGKRIKLGYAKLGAKLLTTPEHVEQFMSDLTGDMKVIAVPEDRPRTQQRSRPRPRITRPGDRPMQRAEAERRAESLGI